MTETPGFTLGIDLGGTKVRTVALAADGGSPIPVWSTTTPTPAHFPPAAMVSLVSDMVGRATDELGAPPAGIGIGFPGLVDAHAGRICSSVIIDGWADVPLVSLVEEVVGRPCSVDNDVNNAARAEVAARRAIDDPAGDLLFISLGTGIGGAVILDGKIWRGVAGLAGEVGHMAGGDHDDPCDCGGNGCVCRQASGRAVERALGIAPGSLAHTLAAAPWELSVSSGGGPGTVVSTAAVRLGRVVADAMNLLNLPLVCLGGGMSDIDGLVEAVDANFRRQAMVEVAASCRVEHAVAGSDAGAVGSALLARTGTLV